MHDEFPATVRTVGTRLVPEDHIYPLDTPEQREAYFRKLAAFKRQCLAAQPVARIRFPGEPRVKRFKTLEEANADDQGHQIRIAQRAAETATYVYR